MTAVDEAIAEIEGLLADIAPQHEGLRDYARLDIEPETLVEVNLSISEYDRRVDLLNVALEALRALAADGHPDLPVREVDPVAFADLQANADTIMAALGQFSALRAATLGLSSSPAEPKPADGAPAPEGI